MREDIYEAFRITGENGRGRRMVELCIEICCAWATVFQAQVLLTSALAWLEVGIEYNVEVL